MTYDDNMCLTSETVNIFEKEANEKSFFLLLAQYVHLSSSLSTSCFSSLPVPKRMIRRLPLASLSANVIPSCHWFAEKAPSLCRRPLVVLQKSMISRPGMRSVGDCGGVAGVVFWWWRFIFRYGRLFSEKSNYYTAERKYLHTCIQVCFVWASSSWARSNGTTTGHWKAASCSE